MSSLELSGGAKTDPLSDIVDIVGGRVVRTSRR